MSTAYALFKKNGPTEETAQTLRDELFFRRATQVYPSLGSRDKPAQNADGSTDIYLGPKAPQGKKATGRPPCPTAGISPSSRSTARPKRRSTKSWKRGDIEKLK